MDLQVLLDDKSKKSKAKTETISRWLLANPGKLKILIEFATKAKDPAKATCIEAIEFATKSEPGISSPACLNFVSEALLENAARIKWESAKVIGNIAHLYPGKLNLAINNLLINTEHTGTVVRWSAAYALAQIIKMKTKQNKDLLPAIEAICLREEQNSIRKIYLEAIKKLKI
ncbi:MAG: hypothetical protein ABIW38_11815 [Ferruginibacter sp.]